MTNTILKLDATLKIIKLLEPQKASWLYINELQAICYGQDIMKEGIKVLSEVK